jgi:hypothetical protein
VKRKSPGFATQDIFPAPHVLTELLSKLNCESRKAKPYLYAQQNWLVKVNGAEEKTSRKTPPNLQPEICQ